MFPPHSQVRPRFVVFSLIAALLASCSHPSSQPGDPSALGPLAAGRQQLLEEALEGLRLSAGRVRITQPAPPSEDFRAALADSRRLQREGRFYEAIAAAARLARAHPAEPRVWERLAQALLSRARLAEAEAALRTGLDLAPTDVELSWQLAAVLQAGRRLPEAIAEWQRNLRLHPWHGPSHARLAVAHALLGEARESRHHGALAESYGHPPPPQLGEFLSGAEAPAVSRHLEQRALLAAPVRVDSGGTSQAAETIVTGDTSGQVLVAGWNDLRQAGAGGYWRLGVATSSNGGAAWTDRIVRAPRGLADDFEGDPFVAHDPRTGNQWVGGVLFGYPHDPPRDSELFVARRQPGTHNFAAAVSVRVDRFVDKPLLVAGARPGLPNTTRLYVTYNLGLQSSDDLGLTWTAPQALDGGIGLQPRLGPNGELYVFYWDLGFHHKLMKSTDGGLTFGPPQIVATRLDVWSTSETVHVPGSFRVAPLGCLAVDPNDGTLYAVYADSTAVSGTEENVDVYFTRSSDGGSTWTVPRVIHGDSTPARDQFHPWLEVGPDGRLHLTFLDTRRTTQLDADPNAFIDVYYAESLDRGESWGEVAVTAQPWESRFAIWPGFEDQFIGDYIGLFRAADGIHLLYPSTVNGNLDIFTQRLDDTLLFANGFESGDLSGWPTVVP